MTAHEEEGRDAQGRPRPGIGIPERDREPKVSGNELSDYSPNSIEDAYADYLVDYGKGGYPGGAPVVSPDASQESMRRTLAGSRIDPAAANKKLFIKTDEYYEDPVSYKPRPTSPVEQLRKELKRLQGGAGEPSLKDLVTRYPLTERDLGTWQAAADLRASTDLARSTLEAAVNRLCLVYDAVITALDNTVRLTLETDKSISRGMRGRSG